MKKRYRSLLFVVLSAMILSACGNKTDSGEEKGQTARQSSEETTQSPGVADENTKDISEEPPEGTSDENAGNLTEEAADTNAETGDEQMQEMIIEVGRQSFRAILYDNDTVRTLTERLPMTLNMEELHGNEKFYYLEEGLPTNSENIGNIQTGDIMLFGSDCLVLFFEDFSTSYNYTRIGHIENAQEFAETLARGTVEVSFRAGE